MPDSICVRCGESEFETASNTPNGSKFTLLFVQCAKCGGVVSAMDPQHLPSSLETVLNRIGGVQQNIARLEEQVIELNRRLTRPSSQ